MAETHARTVAAAEKLLENSATNAEKLRAARVLERELGPVIRQRGDEILQLFFEHAEDPEGLGALVGDVLAETFTDGYAAGVRDRRRRNR